MEELKNKPLVSIIIPTFRNRGNLKRAIDSAINQTYSNIEIIVVDDNNDGDKWRIKTEQLLISINDIRVIYIKHHKNINGAAARNTGIKNSSGEFIAFLDDDDYFYIDKINQQVNYLAKNTQYDAVYCQGDKHGKLIASDLKEGNLTRDILLLNSFMFTPSLLFRKSALLKIHGFDESFRRHQDYELLLRFFSAGYIIGAVQNRLFAIGDNCGENTLSGTKYEDLKYYFFDKFGKYISTIDQTERGFRNKVYALHFSSVFLTYLKEKNFKESTKIFNLYFWNSPIAFLKPIFKSIYYHICLTS